MQAFLVMGEIMEFASVDFTRTVYTCKATGLFIDGMNKETGMPTFGTVETDEFIAGKSNDVAFATKLLRKINKKVIKETISIEIVNEEVKMMTLRDFYNDSITVERQANGRIKR